MGALEGVMFILDALSFCPLLLSIFLRIGRRSAERKVGGWADLKLTPAGQFNRGFRCKPLWENEPRLDRQILPDIDGVMTVATFRDALVKEAG
jgi:hypothetical protein